MNEWLPEQLKTVKSLVEIAQILIRAKQYLLLPTVLEILLVQAQEIVDDHCIVDETP